MNLLIKTIVPLSMICLLASCSSNSIKESNQKQTKLLKNVAIIVNDCCLGDSNLCQTKDVLKIILENIKTGKIKVYEHLEDTIAISLEKINYLFNPPPDTLLVQDPNNQNKMINKLVQSNRFDPYNTYLGYYFIEDWEINESTGEVKKISKGMGIGKRSSSDDGKYEVSVPYFYIKN